MDVGSVKRIHQSDWKTEGVRFLRARDIVSFSKNEKPLDLLYIDNSKYNEYSKISGKVQKGDLLVTGVGSIGVPMLIKSDDPIYFKDGNIIWFKNNNSLNGNFFYYSFTSNKIQNFIRKSSGAGTVGTYTIDNGKKTPILIPKDIDEQEKVGKFLSRFDALIALHQRKLEHLQEQKKGLLQKMFPKNGENVPEVRFPGFTDAWEQRKLGEVAEIVGGGTPSTKVKEYWDGDINWYSPVEIGNSIYASGSVKRITKLGLEKSSAKILPKGTVLFTSRAGIGNTAILSKEAATNQGFQSIVPKKKLLDSYFIFTETPFLKKYGEINGAGSTFVEVSGKQMAKMPLRLPLLEEQKKIGVFFKQIDSLITLHQRKLEHLELMKKGLLQQMFV